ncbi:serine/threonine-protein kinase, partial [Actinoallomurus acaciae]
MERPSAPKTIGGEVLPPGAEPLDVDDPAEIDGHRLRARLPSDGASIVYLAYDAVGKHVAVKTTRAPDQAQARRGLRMEASCARRLPPFCTVALLADGTDHAPPYLVSEYVEGPSLAQYVEALGPLDAEQLMALAVALGRAIAAVHGAGLIHCDLRPANVLLAANGPRIIGFSLAQEAPVSGRPADLGTVPYEPGWVAPERVDGFPAGPASDIFGWGCLVGYAATGRSPYAGDGGNGRWSVAGEETLAALDEPIHGLVEAALAVNPADRPSTGEIASRLGRTAEKPRPVSPPAE